MHNDWVEKKIFIVVKTYPNSSKKYQETVCTAGITEDGDWIRLYPINFRNLEQEKQYDKYTWIKTRIKPTAEALSGRRVDSYTPDLENWEIVSTVGTKLYWSERKAIIYPSRSNSIEHLQQKLNTESRSLGIFKPKKIHSFDIKRNENSSRANPLQNIQQDLFVDAPKPLENIPYEFRYKFSCEDSQCNGHSMIILDWEIFEAYRNWKRTYGEAGALEAIKKKWFDQMCNPTKDTHFIVGTDNRFNKFMVLGVFWPELQPYQDLLF